MKEEVVVAQIGGGGVAGDRAAKLLSEANIGYTLDGSVALDVAVLRKDAERAKKLLQQEFREGELGFRLIE